MRRRLSLVALVVISLVVAGCPIGSSAGGFVPARGPQGVKAWIQLEGTEGPRGTVVCELLAISDSALVILADNLVVRNGEVVVRQGQRVQTVSLIAYTRIRNARFHQVSEQVRQGRVPDPKTIERLRLVSRYPQGISSELQDQLLRAYEQPALAVLR